ncbi:uncharacterized protein LOC120774570 [Bactrocera tryoni]|uniref:uncharacterized protein LOC120774570 n=1 Tax=Bactrocera tryoni TaxID=59916 RepID=UPI001A982385|nr:uncharacterized protein LOC120774570 [Bactrocera tryoni]
MFDLIVRCREFSDFTLRVNEKRLLNALNDTPLRFPRLGRIKTREDKISCLLQAVLGNIPIAFPTLAQESLKMLRIGDRIAKCLMEYMRLSEHQAHALHLGRYKALLHTVTIAKCFHAKLWENSEYAAKQLQKIGAVYSAQLVCAGKTTLKSLGATDARTIEAILNKSYPFGDEILQNLQQTFPEYSLQLTRDSQSLVRVCVRQVNGAYICHGINALLIVGDSENQLLLFIEDLDSLLLEYGCFMKTIKLPNPDVEQLYAHVIHATLVGADVHETLILNERVMESTIVSNSKKSKKRKQQTRVTAKCNKKVKPNLSKTISTICDTTTNSTLANKNKLSLNLKSFTFSKSKLSNDAIKLKAVKVEQHFAQSKMNCAKYLNITDTTTNEESFNTTYKQSNNNSTLVQSKLTQYFTQRKRVKDKSLTMLTERSADECAVSHMQDKSEVTLDRTLDTTLLKYQRLLKQRDLDFDKLRESQGKQESERDLIVINNAPGQKTSDTVEITKPGAEECAKLPIYEAEPKNEQKPTVQPSLRATTPELHDLSAFLDTQKSRQSNEETQKSKNAECLELSAFLDTQKSRQSNEETQKSKNAECLELSAFLGTQKSRQSNEETQKSKNAECLEILTSCLVADCSILNGTQNSLLLNTQNTRSSSEEVQNNNPVKSTEKPTLRKAPISFLDITKNNEQLSSFFDKPKDKTNNSFDSSVSNSRIFNCGVSNMMQKEFVRGKAMSTNNEKPLDLTRKSNYLISPYKKNVKHLKATKSTLMSQHTPNTNTVKSAKVPRGHLKYPEEDIGVLDLSRRSETNLNMSWCDSKAVYEVSAGSITLTSKSSEVPLRNSQKSIENYILCYKVATAYARLSEKERTIENFKTLYKRVGRTSSAIDYITYKLSHSSISHDEEPKAVPVQKSVTRHYIKSAMVNSLEKSELPLNMSKKLIVEKQVKNVLNSDNVKSTAPVLRSKFTKIKNNEEKMCPKLSNGSRNPDTSSKFPNRYRLQLNEVNSEAKNAQYINNEVMHLVLNMKCDAIVAEETYQTLPDLDYKAIEQNIQLNETQSSPSMSFEEYCSYVLQTPTK